MYKTNDREDALAKMMREMSRTRSATTNNVVEGLSISFEVDEERAEGLKWIYYPNPTPRKFHDSKARVRVLEGPIRCGKTAAAIVDCILYYPRRCVPEVDKNGLAVIRVRSLFARLTYDRLLDNTLVSTLKLLPKELPYQWNGARNILRFEFFQNIGGKKVLVKHEIMFRSFEHKDDEDRLRGMELSQIFVDEYSDFRHSYILTQGLARTGQYTGGQPQSLVMASNPPASDHWLCQYQEEKPNPEDAEFFMFPSGLSPDAENIKNLGDKEYYQRTAAVGIGVSRGWVDRMIRGKRVSVHDGRVVHADYSPEMHRAPMNFIFEPSLDLHIGVDFGLTPAAVFGQRMPAGNWRVLDAFWFENADARIVAERILVHLDQYYNNASRVFITGDPAGRQRSQTNIDETPFKVMNVLLNARGLKAMPATTNEVEVRHGVVNRLLSMIIDGVPGLQLSHPLANLDTAMTQYRYERVQSKNSDVYRDVPVKDKYSHICEALGYMLLGGGEGGRYLGKGMKREQIRPENRNGLQFGFQKKFMLN